MMENRIEILDQNNQSRAEAGGKTVILTWNGTYEEGDRILLTFEKSNCFYVVRVDDSMDESLIYVTGTQLSFVIPFGEKKLSYNPKAFTGEVHYLTLRPALDFEYSQYRNLAKNPLDQHDGQGCYPHAHANVETRGESVFAARNAIDGMTANTSHGNWPYESWGINRQTDAKLTVSFGRPVDVDQVVLWTRADFPHDSWWERVSLFFSDGTKETVTLEKSTVGHQIPVQKKGITWVALGELIRADDPSPFPALTELEVYGRESQ